MNRFATRTSIVSVSCLHSHIASAVMIYDYEQYIGNEYRPMVRVQRFCHGSWKSKTNNTFVMIENVLRVGKRENLLFCIHRIWMGLWILMTREILWNQRWKMIENLRISLSVDELQYWSVKVSPAIFNAFAILCGIRHTQSNCQETKTINPGDLDQR